MLNKVKEKFQYYKSLFKKYKIYIISLIIFIWLLVFDSSNIIDLIKLKRDVSELKKQRKYYQTEISEANKQYQHLFSNKRNLETFAREKYLMKKDNEDIFIILEEK